MLSPIAYLRIGSVPILISDRVRTSWVDNQYLGSPASYALGTSCVLVRTQEKAYNESTKHVLKNFKK